MTNTPQPLSLQESIQNIEDALMNCRKIKLMIDFDEGNNLGEVWFTVTEDGK